MFSFGGGSGQELSPEALQQLMELGALDDEEALAEEQMQLALALQQPGQKYNTPTAAGIAGIGDIFRAVSGAAEERNSKNKRKEISEKRTAGRKRFADEFFGPQAQLKKDRFLGAQGIPDALGAQGTPFSYGNPGGFGYTPGGY